MRRAQGIKKRWELENQKVQVLVAPLSYLIDLEYKNYKNLCYWCYEALTGTPDHAEYIQRVIEDNGYNPWLWCDVEVIGNYKGLSTSEHLAQCAYKNEQEFKEGIYYEDMQNIILEELNKMVSDIAKDLAN